MEVQHDDDGHEFIDYQWEFVPGEQNVAAFINGALRLARRVTKDVILLDILEDGRTFAEVGRDLFPKVHVKIAQMAVAHAARRVLTGAQLEEVRKRNRTKGGREGALSFMPEGYVFDGQHKPVEEKTDWLPEESNRLLELAGDPAYQYTSGMHSGKPCFRLICDILNEEFHKGKRRRNMNSCARKWKRLLRERNGEESSADSPHNLPVDELPLAAVGES